MLSGGLQFLMVSALWISKFSLYCRLVHMDSKPKLHQFNMIVWTSFFVFKGDKCAPSVGGSFSIEHGTNLSICFKDNMLANNHWD